MEYLALYRKYRPDNLDEVVGQSEIKKILATSVMNGTITHAYLFSGPRGTGKTTMAKILSKMVNCLHPVDGNACGKCDICLNILKSNDVIEIDAASNNGVDEIRNLREKATLVPNNAKYKVYIIDEVHMLTTQAFNALLKILEEPPKHVIFILATTEYYKIPLTITSRCQKFQFSKISDDELVNRLKKISELENIDIDDSAICEIARISDGGMRDAINFLDQLRSFSGARITIENVYEVCGDISTNELLKLLVAVKSNDCEFIVSFFENMSKNGKNFGKFLENIMEFLKDVVLKYSNVSYKYIKNNEEVVNKIVKMYTLDEIFAIIDCVNQLFEKMKNVSRQSVVVITNFLSMANNLNHLNNDNDMSENKEKKLDFTLNNASENAHIDNVVNNENLDVKEIFNENQISFINKDVIINNVFAVASKELKNDLQSKITYLNNYLTDNRFKLVSGVLIDVNIEVAGPGYLLFSAPNDAIVDKVCKNYDLCKELLSKIFESEYEFVVVNQREWESYRDEYIKNIKNAYNYKIKELKKEENNESMDIVNPTVVDKLFDIVGEDSIEFK